MRTSRGCRRSVSSPTVVGHRRSTARFASAPGAAGGPSSAGPSCRRSAVRSFRVCATRVVSAWHRASRGRLDGEGRAARRRVPVLRDPGPASLSDLAMRPIALQSPGRRRVHSLVAGDRGCRSAHWRVRRQRPRRRARGPIGTPPPRLLRAPTGRPRAPRRRRGSDVRTRFGPPLAPFAIPTFTAVAVVGVVNLCSCGAAQL